MDIKTDVAFLTNVEAILFDIDGTLTNTDHFHVMAFQELLSELNFVTNQPKDMIELEDGTRVISEEFFRMHISGKHNPQIFKELFPTWTTEQIRLLSQRKEALFRKKAANSLVATKGLDSLVSFLQKSFIPIAAVTNAPRLNAEFSELLFFHC